MRKHQRRAYNRTPITTNAAYIRLPVELDTALRDIAAADGVNISSVQVLALTYAVTQHKAGKFRFVPPSEASLEEIPNGHDDDTGDEVEPPRVPWPQPPHRKKAPISQPPPPKPEPESPIPRGRGKRRSVWDSGKDEQLLALRDDSGLTVVEKAKRLGISVAGYYKRIKQLDVSPATVEPVETKAAPGSTWTPDQDAEFEMLWNNGATMAYLQSRFECAKEQILAKRKELGLPSRKPIRSDAQREVEVDASMDTMKANLRDMGIPV